MKKYYIQRYVCGKSQFLNLKTGQWSAELTEECYCDESEHALYRAASQAFPGALVYEAKVA